MGNDTKQDIAWVFGEKSTGVCAAIGRISMLWSHMEFVLDLCIFACVAGRIDRVECLTNQQQVLSKIDALSSLLGLDHPTLYGPFQKVANLIRGHLVSHRNTFIHGLWLMPSILPMPLVAKKGARGKLVTKGGPVPVETLNNFAHDIEDVIVWLIELFERLPALPDTPYEQPRKTPPQGYALQKAQALRPLASQALPER